MYCLLICVCLCESQWMHSKTTNRLIAHLVPRTVTRTWISRGENGDNMPATILAIRSYQTCSIQWWSISIVILSACYSTMQLNMSIVFLGNKDKETLIWQDFCVQCILICWLSLITQAPTTTKKNDCLYCFKQKKNAFRYKLCSVLPMKFKSLIDKTNWI